MPRILPFIAIGAALLVLLAAAYGEALARPIIVTYDVAVPGWSAPPLRIVQLSDLHRGWPDMPLARLRRIVDQANALRPDVIALTGDFAFGKLADLAAGNLDEAVRPLARLRSRFGTFAVRGNHDDPYWTPRTLPRYGMTYLENAHADAGPITVAGIDDLSTGHADLDRALAGIAPGQPILLLMHEPDSFVRVPACVTLTLAGHTHGGQVKLPLIGTPLTNTAFGYVRGRFAEGERTMIVSSGVGTSTLPVRWNVPPEIVVVTMHAP